MLNRLKASKQKTYWLEKVCSYARKDFNATTGG